MMILLLSLIMLIYIFEFGIVHAQNYDQDNDKEIDNNFDYIFDPGNYIEFEKEEDMNVKVVVRNNKSDNENNLVKSSSSSTSDYNKEEIERSNNINTVKKK